MKNHKNALTFIFITVLIDVIGLGIIIPVLPDLIKELTGEGLSEASKYNAWLTFSYAIMQFFCSPILGALSDKFGRRPILLISLLGLGIDYVFQAISPSLALLFVGRIIAGAAGASFSTATAYIADISEPEKRSQNFGLIGAAFGIGFILGPIIGGLSSSLGVRAAFWIASGFSILNFIYGYFVIPESLEPQNRRNFTWKNADPLGSFKNLKKYKLVLGLIIGEFLIMLAGKSVELNWNYFTKYKFDWSNATIYYSLAFVGVVIALVQGWLIRLIIPKIGERKAAYVGLFCEVSGLTLLGMATQGWMMFVFLIPYAFGGIGGAAIQGLISNHVSNDEQGELQGTINGLNSLTYIIGPLLMNNLFYYFTSKYAPFEFPGAPFIMGSILAFIGFFCCHITLRKVEFKTNV